jgi:zinc protease
MRNRQFARVWLAAALVGFAAAAHAILPIQHWETKNGARVYFVENRNLPMLDVSVGFPAGASFDQREKAGLASLTNALLRLGAKDMDEHLIASRLADVGAQLGSQFDTDFAGLTLRTLSSRTERNQALGVLARLLAQPLFPEAVLEREKARLIARIREADTRPGTIASVMFYQLLYREHPYSQRESGDATTVQRLTRQDLVAFHRRHYVARHAVVAMIGDVSREEAAAIAEQLTTGLPGGNAGVPELPTVSALSGPVTRFIAHPATQSHILVGAPGMRRDDPDYFALFVGNQILGGGGFVSRINEEVRQKRGLAYSAYSYFSPLKAAGPFLIGMQTKREQAQEALQLVRATLREFLANGPTEDELAAAKKNIVGGFPLRIDSNRKIHAYLSMIGSYRLPLTYLDDFVGNVERVTVADIRRAFARLDPERMVTVVVGAEEPAATAAAQ